MDILKKCLDGPSCDYIGGIKKWCCIWHAQEHCYEIEKNRNGKLSKSSIPTKDEDELD
jgi:hypothetical protein